MIGYFNKDIRTLVSIMPKMSGYVKTFKVKNRDKAIWTKIEDLKNTELNPLLTFDDRQIKTRLRTYSDKFIPIFVV